MSFDELRVGNSSTSKSWIPGRACKSVKVQKVVVVCPMERDQRCPGFYYIQIPEVSVVGIKRQKVEAK